MRHERTISIGADHPAIPGHFPGHPIVPGVLLLGEVVETVRQLIRQPFELTALPNMKFMSPVRPGEAITIRADHEREGVVLVSCRVGGQTVARGSLEYRAVSGQ